jgi:GntR family transcriptional regulator, transcriptional repressor for pyruvate dehydrogenase complex
MSKNPLLPIQPVRHIQVPEATLNHLLTMIGEGYWQPGERLPAQRELASHLGISISSLREALQALQVIGVLEVRQGEGTFVSSHSDQAVQQLIKLSLPLMRLDVTTLFEARIVLEGGLSYFAARRATPEQVSSLFKNLNMQKQAIEADHLDTLYELDLAFHRQIAEMAGSEFLKQIDVPLFHALENLLREMPHTMDGWSRHRDVAVAIRDHDAEKASRAMRLLIESAAQRYARWQATKSQFDEKNLTTGDIQ